MGVLHEYNIFISIGVDMNDYWLQKKEGGFTTLFYSKNLYYLFNKDYFLNRSLILSLHMYKVDTAG